MLVLIATNELQGAAPGDYSRTVEGELVTPIVAECRDHFCDCHRGFPGLASGQATTTALVAERPGVTAADLREFVLDHLDRTGWIELVSTEPDCPDCAVARAEALCRFHDVDEMIESMVSEHVAAIVEVCAAYPVGTVLERRGDLIVARSARTAA